MARRMRRRTVAAGGRDCSLASRRPGVATGHFASRQIAALFHLRLAVPLSAVPNPDAQTSSPTVQIIEAVLVP
jgi:hypothetical protein